MRLAGLAGLQRKEVIYARVATEVSAQRGCSRSWVDKRRKASA